MQRINFFAVALLLFCVHSIGNAQATNHQRTKIAIVGLVHSHCWGFVTKLNQMHQSGDLIGIVGISDDNQELRDYIKTQAPGVPVYDNYAKMLDEKKPEVVWSFVENDRHLEVTKACASGVKRSIASVESVGLQPKRSWIISRASHQSFPSGSTPACNNCK